MWDAWVLPIHLPTPEAQLSLETMALVAMDLANLRGAYLERTEPDALHLAAGQFWGGRVEPLNLGRSFATWWRAR